MKLRIKNDKVNDDEPVVELSLRQGIGIDVVTLQATLVRSALTWNILSISSMGITRHRAVSKNLGLPLTEDGSVKMD
jgi:hypothetical protein